MQRYARCLLLPMLMAAGVNSCVAVGVAGGVVVDAAAAPAAPATGGACSAAGGGDMAAEGTNLVLRDSTGQSVARWPLRDAQGRPGTLLAVCALPLRHSHVIVVQGWTELWEISHDPTAPPIYDGLVHDWRMGEGISRPGYLGIRRIRLEHPWMAVFSDDRVPWLLGAEASADGRADAVVLHLDVRRAVARWPLGTLDEAAARGGWLYGSALQGAATNVFTLRLPASDGDWRLIDIRTWRPHSGSGTPGSMAPSALDAAFTR